MSAKRVAWTRSAAIVAAVLVVPWWLRLILLGSGHLGATDARGFLADAGVALFVAIVACWAARAATWLAVLLIGLWVLLCYANYEHVHTLGANLALDYSGYLADSTFLLGSALAISSPLLLGITLAIGVGLGWVALRRGPVGTLLFAGLALLAWVTRAALPEDPETLHWRQTNVVLENAASAWTDDAPTSPGAAPAPAPAWVGDLDGEPRVALPGVARNVLVVVIEGISGVHIAPIAEANGRSTRFQTPALGELAGRGLTYTSFVAQQRQTNRGEYALLCGDYPKLRSEAPKMSEALGHPDLDCLPALLARAGYATVYLQAAPLGFMLKDQFMPRTGFERVLGEPWFTRAYRRNKWGVDDVAFVEQSLTMIDELRAVERPWFLTLLTSGTHHPFNVPDDAPPATPPGPFGRAVRYADRAVGLLIAGLEQRGVLRDTLVLVTSDESAGSDAGSDVEQMLSRNWGFLMALLPEGEVAQVSEPFALMDLPLSVIDYLGLENEPGFLGRSVFRRYAAPRELAFGNTYARTVGALTPDEHLTLCDEPLESCTRWATPGGRLFAAAVERTADPGPAEKAVLQRLIDGSRRLQGAAPVAPRELELVVEPRIRLQADTRDIQYLFGGQDFSVPAGTRIDVELELVLEGEAGRVDLMHDLVSGHDELFFRRLVDFAPGDRFRARYSYVASEPLHEIESRLWARRIRGDDLTLHVVAGRVRLRPSAPRPKPLVVEELALQRRRE